MLTAYDMKFLHFILRIQLVTISKQKISDQIYRYYFKIIINSACRNSSGFPIELLLLVLLTKLSYSSQSDWLKYLLMNSAAQTANRIREFLYIRVNGKRTEIHISYI